MRDKNGRFVKGNKVTFSESHLRKLSEAAKRRVYSEERNKKVSSSLLGRKIPDATRKKMSLAKRGDKTHLWKGGVSKENRTERQNIMATVDYKLWRKSVFERDSYKCVWCGYKGYVEADHIKPFSLYPELRFAIDNGRTLCRPCHKSVTHVKRILI